MPVVSMHKILTIPLAFLISACASGDEWTSTPTTAAPPESAACAPLMQFNRMTFLAADSNGDGVIDEAEFSQDVAAAFSGEDRIRDYQLARSELPEAPSGTFERLDSDGNGLLSFSEVRRVKLAQFERADTNGDGVLSISEVMRFNTAQHGGC